MAAFAFLLCIAGIASVPWLMANITFISGFKPKSHHPPVTIIITAYNQALGLKRIISSIEAAFGDRAEAIVCDLGSQDSTVEVARGLGLETIVVMEEQSSLSMPKKDYARYLASKRAKCRMLLFVDCGVTVKPEMWAKLFGAWKPGMALSVEPKSASSRPEDGLLGIYRLIRAMGMLSFAIGDVKSPSLCPDLMLIERKDYFKAMAHGMQRKSKDSGIELSKACMFAGLKVMTISGGDLAYQESRPWLLKRFASAGKMGFIGSMCHLFGGLSLLFAVPGGTAFLGWLWLYIGFGVVSAYFERKLGEYSWLWAACWPLQLFTAFIVLGIDLAKLLGLRAPVPFALRRKKRQVEGLEAKLEKKG